MPEPEVDGGELDVRLVGPGAWALWRHGRLRALLDSPTAFGSTYERELAFTADQWRDRLASESASVLGTVDGEVVAMGGGFVPGDGWCHLFGMWVEPAWRRHGLSRRVLDVLIAWASERRLPVSLDVTVGNDAARAAYERTGFVATGETRPLRPGATERLERMVLPSTLGASAQISDS
jgi:GNAT superfamily N-acetyltransferase